jgi:hypothetical protein
MAETCTIQHVNFPPKIKHLLCLHSISVINLINIQANHKKKIFFSSFLPSTIYPPRKIAFTMPHRLSIINYNYHPGPITKRRKFVFFFLFPSTTFPPWNNSKYYDLTNFPYTHNTKKICPLWYGGFYGFGALRSQVITTLWWRPFNPKEDSKSDIFLKRYSRAGSVLASWCKGLGFNSCNRKIWFLNYCNL